MLGSPICLLTGYIDSLVRDFCLSSTVCIYLYVFEGKNCQKSWGPTSRVLELFKISTITLLAMQNLVCNYVTTLLRYYVTTILHYYDTTLLQYYDTTLLQYYVTTILCYYDTMILQYYITMVLRD